MVCCRAQRPLDTVRASEMDPYFLVEVAPATMSAHQEGKKKKKSRKTRDQTAIQISRFTLPFVVFNETRRGTWTGQPCLQGSRARCGALRRWGPLRWQPGRRGLSQQCQTRPAVQRL